MDPLAEVKVETSYVDCVDLFGIGSIQSQRIDNPPTPSPPHRHKERWSEDREDRHVVEVDDDIDNIDDSNDGGGKQGGGGGGSDRGGGKRNMGF